ncbi:S41 family peptidase [Brachybacterium hainanense]|uniref:PDZ domain-containing protein n=1 Tax=Brachybacterium hainanense TaxID=1541174 RepID=A0ABV6R9I0_9MICO
MTATSSSAPAPASAAAGSAGYLRHPDVHGDLVVFTAADDVWLAPLAGGQAWRLTDDGAPVRFPRFSPDGAHVAYVSLVTGSPEVFVVAADGSQAPRRLTVTGNRTTRVAGWLEDGRILMTTAHGAPLSLRDAQLWALGLDGSAELLPLGRSSEAAIHEDGTTVVVTMWRRESATWKHYQGGTAPKLWISREPLALDAPREAHAQRTWEPLLDEILAGKTRVAWYGDRLIFAADTPGPGAALTDRASGNLWSVDATGTDLRRHTDLTSEQGYLREPATDGTTIVFTSRGRLFAMDSLDAAPREVEVRTAGVAAARRPRRIDPAENLLAMRPTHDARASLVEWRGTAHLLTHRGGPARLLAGESGLRIREVRPLGRSPFALFVSDAAAQQDRVSGGVGSDDLHVRRLDAGGPEVPLGIGALTDGGIGRILHAFPSPDGARVALSTHDNRLWLAELDGVADPAAGPDAAAASAAEPAPPTLTALREVSRSEGGEIRSASWSPDGRFLVWTEPNSWELDRLLLLDAEAPTDSEEAVRALTSGRTSDFDPAFSADGKHLAFLSGRTFETQYDDLVFDLAFISSQRPFLLPLERTTRDPFGPDADGWTSAAEAGDGKDGDRTDGNGADSPTVMAGAGTGAAAGAEGAKTPAPGSGADTTSPASADSAAGAGAAKTPPRTVIDADAAEERIVPFPVESGHMRDLHAVTSGFIWIRQPQEGVLGTARAGVEGEGPKPVLEHWNLADRKLTVLAEGVDAVEVSGSGDVLVIRQGTSWTAIPSDRKVEDEDPARIGIGTERLRLAVDPVAERRGMLWDSYRIMAQQYWREDMDGQDWHAMTSWYDEVIDRVVTEDDFADMMWEVVGELGTSHAYIMPKAASHDLPETPAHLGVDLRRDGDAWVIARILPGDSTDPDARSPLRAPGVAAEVGDAIVRVDGRDVDAARGVEELLIGSAGRPTELVLSRDGRERRVVVVPLADDTQLRYQAWVASRRAAVAELSGGRLGYLHIPDMVSGGWAQMHRDLREASGREGIVVDVRYNNGGHTSQLVTDRLARRVLSWGYPRHQRPDTYPAFAPRGPLVLVTNQEAGSDGDIVNAVSRAMGIGPVIGTRTWGGVIGIDGRYDLVDGTGITQPKYASWFEGVEWSIENYGVDPDIEVPFPPSAWVAGVDPQLERGVAEALALLEEHPAAVPPPLPPARFGPSKG